MKRTMNVGFVNPETSKEDETQFDISCEAELKELWWDFCKENGIITYAAEEGESMNKEHRKKVVLAMEMIARCINDEGIFESWLTVGVADGDIPLYSTDTNDVEDYYIEDDNFKDLMTTFLKLMSRAWKSGGLYEDNIVSRTKDEKVEVQF